MRPGERKEFCVRGHSLLDPSNVRYNKRGAAVCKACKKMRERAYQRPPRTYQRPPEGPDLDAARRNARWTDEELGYAADRSMTAVEVARQIDRSVGAVRRMRARINAGWVPSGEPPLTDDELAVVRNRPELTAERIAEILDRPYHMITAARRGLIAQEGAYFGKGPYDKDPCVVGDRLLLAKTCVRCGVIRGGADFGKDRAQCRFCRAETRDRIKDRADRLAAEQRVRELAVHFNVPYMSRHYEEYTEADVQILARQDLTLCERAAMLGRSYQAANQAATIYGVTTTRPERREPHGVWLISMHQASCEYSRSVDLAGRAS